jgi:hypothetical protein
MLETKPAISPKRKIGKQEAIRRLIHTAIRMVMNEEDPFAVHLLIHSADKSLTELAGRRGADLALNWKEYVKEADLKQFFRRHRAIYNYLKHADSDAFDELSAGDISIVNVMDLFIAILNYDKLFSERTDHMKFFSLFVLVLAPIAAAPPNMKLPELPEPALRLYDLTPRDLFAAAKLGVNYAPNYKQEVERDLADSREFYSHKLIELRGRYSTDALAMPLKKL